jgi:hypothetical protein
MVQLLNEYDRIFLYRSLAMRKSARPEQYEASTCLTIGQRRAVATRLERFFATSIFGKTPKRVEAWRTGVEERLGVKVQIDAVRPALAVAAQREESLRSLAGFLVDIKQREPQHLRLLLSATKVAQGLEEVSRDNLFRSLSDEPPFFFEPPNIDPDGEIAKLYLEDLARLAIATPPCDLPIEPMIEDVGAFLRHDLRELRTLLDRIRAEVFQSRFVASVKPPKVSPTIARAALWVLEPQEQVQFLYEGVTRRSGLSASSTKSDSPELLLLGTDQRLLAVEPGESPRAVWLADATMRIASDDGRLVAGATITGGTWLDTPANSPLPKTLQVRGQPLWRFEIYFYPLLALRAAPLG